jgi:hypothetical protein
MMPSVTRCRWHVLLWSIAVILLGGAGTGPTGAGGAAIHSTASLARIVPHQALARSLSRSHPLDANGSDDLFTDDDDEHDCDDASSVVSPVHTPARATCPAPLAIVVTRAPRRAPRPASVTPVPLAGRSPPRGAVRS